MMKYALFAAFSLMAFNVYALEYELQFENNQVRVARVKVMTEEVLDLHRDELPQVVIALHGGTITRLESNGTTTDVHFPTGVAVFREADPPGELHRSVNHSTEPVELITIQLKTNEPST